MDMSCRLTYFTYIRRGGERNDPNQTCGFFFGLFDFSPRCAAFID